jgi:hypothetical protein
VVQFKPDKDLYSTSNEDLLRGRNAFDVETILIKAIQKHQHALFGSLRGLREFRNHQTYEAFIPLFQLRELPAKAFDFTPFT